MAGAFLGVERSFAGRAWRAREGDERTALALSQRFELPEIVGRVLAARGIGLDDAEAHLDPTLRRFLPDPSHLKDMDRAAERIARAVVAGEPVAIFGDYDVDGATSSALLARFLAAVGTPPRIYIPDRQSEGYGPNAPAMQKLAREGARVVVTVDCGITAHAPLQAARDAGLDVVVIDHHIAEAGLPPAFAVVDPNRLDETSPHRQLAAVGVAFLLAVAVNRALRQAGHFAKGRAEPDLKQWLDLVALGTVCDVVPLVGVNRALVRQGLSVMAGRANIGLAALADVAGLKTAPDAYHLGFILGPRVNAGGRVGEAALGARLLSTGDPAEARRIAEHLDELNRERQRVERQVLEAAVAQIDARGDPGPVVVASSAGWHPGVIGIVASRLKERYGRPAFVVAIEQDGTGKGSGRSLPGVDMGETVIAARQAGLLVNGGGHAMAAGFTVAPGKLPALVEFLTPLLAPGGAAAMPTLDFDGALYPAAATPALVDTLERLGPFGAGNPRPVFALPDARVVRAEAFGNAHVRCILTGQGGGRLSAVAFRALGGELGPALLRAEGAGLHVAGSLRADNYQGRARTQFFIEDAAAVS